MSTIRAFIRREPVLLIALLFAAISCFFVPPDQEYLKYIDFRTLALLYCLMVVVSGLRMSVFFTHFAHTLCEKASSVRAIGLILILLCYFSSMFITNDVALLTFVPFAVVVMAMIGRKKELIFVVVMQTVAANLGSMLTPMGNPQNLYLYSFYDLNIGQFLQVMGPPALISLILILVSCILLPRAPITLEIGEEPGIQKDRLFLYTILFIICLLAVAHIMSWQAMLIIVITILLVVDGKVLIKADFMLLLTFVAFFIFSGNLARMDIVNLFLQKTLNGHEYLTALLTSQVISNVPAALLLADFTHNTQAMLLGVNIGGLGTPIASLASLISLKLYSLSSGANAKKYLLIFLFVNIISLAFLSCFAILLTET